MEIVAHGQVSVELHVAGDGCPNLSDNVKATFNGQPMNIARGGSATDAFGCYPIAFYLDDAVTPTQLEDYELKSSAASGGAIGSQLVISDSSAAWQIAPTRLFGNHLENDVANSRIVWQDVDQIVTARVAPVAEVRVEGDSIFYPPGTQVVYADATAHPVPTVCSGPSHCTVDFEDERTFNGPVKQN
jgi:hypothetical protein